MAEYIEREALIKAVRIMPRTIRPELVRYSTVQAIIDKQPAADVVEVVRCKDCKHGRTCADNDEEIMCVLDCEYDKDTGVDYGFMFRHSKTHFCSYGKRRCG